ncbi:MAG: LysR family transcriptional regulator [Oscillospiraceae bacterium]|nr:LysR family transcriptional regulator [Oscillospiraceae bacterium]
MTLDQLRYFRAVCQCDSVSRAAEILNISQPSISNAVRNLEKELDVVLFMRQRKKLILTKEGQQMLSMAEDILDRADDLQRTMKALGSKNKALRLGVPPMVGSLVLPALFGKDFQQCGLRVHIVEGDRTGLKGLLSDGQIDMAFLPHVDTLGADLCAEKLAVLENVCCVSKRHPLAKRKSVGLRELAQEPLVLFKNSFFQTERILGEFSRLSCVPNVLLDTAQVSTVQNMVAANVGVGFMFAFLLKTVPDLVGIPLDPPMTTQVSLVWRENTQFSEAGEKIAQYMKIFLREE